MVDSGAEVNVIDREFAQTLKIETIASTTAAQAANKIPLDVFGQSKEPISVECLTETGSKMLYLGIVLIVNNLGVPCLLGEPAKLVNNIICLPRHKLILLASGPDVHYAKYDANEVKYTLARAPVHTILNPGDQLCYKLPEQFKAEAYVAVSPRPNTESWLSPTVAISNDCSVYLTNSSKWPVSVNKSEHLADIRSTKFASLPHSSPYPKASHDD